MEFLLRNICRIFAAEIKKVAKKIIKKFSVPDYVGRLLHSRDGLFDI